MIEYNVDLASRSYPIYIGKGVIERVGSELSELKPTRILVVTNTTVGPLYAETVTRSIRRALPEVPLAVCTLKDGEIFKTPETLREILQAAADLHADRSSVIVALGGGVIGDMAGFAASMWMRGIRFVQIPTTLLSQVDSSVGGKTGVNLPQGKNLIGAFYQPKFVLIDPQALKTLPAREISAGLGEIIKYGVLGDAAFFSRLENEMPRLRNLDMQPLEEVIAHCCHMKAQIVKADEREAGVRATLNLGHTFAHAIEKLAGYGVWLHGEAVGAGLVMAASLSQVLGLIAPEDVARVRHAVAVAGLPVRIEGIGANQAIQAMYDDKKAKSDTLRFVVIRAIGESFVSPVKESVVRAVLGEYGWK